MNNCLFRKFPVRILLSFYCLIFIGTVSCSSEIEIKDELGKYFAEMDVQGTFVLYDLTNDIYTGYNDSQWDVRHIPASTFKILNSLIGLETGAVTGPDYRIEWDGKKRPVETWNQDHTLRSAIKHSVVWYYQEIARRVGQERMQKMVDAVDYGNRDISGGIDMFWLSGDLRISPLEQITFLKKLYDEKLPFSTKNIAIVKDILIRESDTSGVLRSKTGTAGTKKGISAWNVGWLEKEGKAYLFALYFEPDGKKLSEVSSIRNSLTAKLLADLCGYKKENYAGRERPVIVIKTEQGDVEAELYPEKAPVTVENFLKYVENDMFRYALFHRTVRDGNQPDNSAKIAVIQAGRARGGTPGFAPIKLETTNWTGVLHKNGTISMARSGPDTGTSHFFICIGDQPALNFGGKRNPDGMGFAAFGIVIKGMDVVRKIHRLPADGQRLIPPVKIYTITMKGE